MLLFCLLEVDENQLEFASATSHYNLLVENDSKNFTYFAPKCKGELFLEPGCTLTMSRILR